MKTIAVLSDIHYAGEMERAKGKDYEYRGVDQWWLRTLMRNYRQHIWLSDPLGQNSRLDEFLAKVGQPDLVIANGDYNCDTNFVGVSDDGSLQSARECLGRLKDRFGEKFLAIAGDHEFGKLSFVGGNGGMRLESWRRAQALLGLRSMWTKQVGNSVLIGVTSSLIAEELFQKDMLESERAEWHRLSQEHIRKICAAFSAIKSGQKIILFCHDPSALPILWEHKAIRDKLNHIEQTMVGHIHSPFIFNTAKLIAGMPPIGFMGYTVKRMTRALNAAGKWKHFKVRLCPSLAGIELFKDGGFYTIQIDEGAKQSAKFIFHPLPR